MDLKKQKGIRAECEKCGSVNYIPIKHFYDGCEGPFFCKECGEVLDVDVEIDEGE